MKLYVGNFAYTTTESELRDLFSTQGSVVNVRIIHDHFTRQSKCFGYVKMLTKGEGTRAIDTLHGKKINDRNIDTLHGKKINDRNLVVKIARRL